jgi:hypothetical protein
LYVDVAEIKHLGGFNELDDGLRQIILVVFHCQNLIASLSDDSLANVRLAPQGVHGDNTAFE